MHRKAQSFKPLGRACRARSKKITLKSRDAAINCWSVSFGKKSSRRRGLASWRISIECSPTPSVGLRFRLTARQRRPLSLSPPCCTSNGLVWARSAIFTCFRSAAATDTSPCRTRQGLVCSAVTVTITSTGEQRHRLSHFYARLGFAQSGRMSAFATLDA
jgi:hypothetical protein